MPWKCFTELEEVLWCADHEMILKYWLFNIQKAQFWRHRVGNYLSLQMWIEEVDHSYWECLRSVLCCTYLQKSYVSDISNIAKRWTKEGLVFIAMTEHSSDNTRVKSLAMFVDHEFLKHAGNWVSVQKPPRWNLAIIISLFLLWGQRNTCYTPCPLGTSCRSLKPESSSSRDFDHGCSECWILIRALEKKAPTKISVSVNLN